MSFYTESIVPRLLHLGMQSRAMREQRRDLLSPLRGRVLELGFGSGLNLAHYPAAVTEVVAIEPSRVACRLARANIARHSIGVHLLGLRGEQLPLDSGSVDSAVSTWTLCTIPDLPCALAELRRVLRAGAQLHFLEHGLSQEPRVARWQARLNGLQMSLCGGCRLDRQIDRELLAAGFRMDELQRFTMPGPRTHAAMYRGRASSS